MIRIHSHLRGLIRDVRDTNDGVVGHGITFLRGVVCGQVDRPYYMHTGAQARLWVVTNLVFASV